MDVLYGHPSITYLYVFILFSVSLSAISLCITYLFFVSIDIYLTSLFYLVSFFSTKSFMILSSCLSFTEPSIKTGDILSRNLPMISNTSIIAGDVILGSVDFTCIYSSIDYFTLIELFYYFCKELLSLVHIDVMISHIIFLPFSSSWIVSFLQ